MVRIEEFVFGYRILNVEQVDFGIATALLYRMGIPFTQRNKGTLIINEAYIPKAEKVFKEKNIAYNCAAQLFFFLLL